MPKIVARVVTLLVVGVSLSGAFASAAGPLDRENLLRNGGFDGDNFNLRAEVMSCPVRPRVTFGQSDTAPDDWNYDALQPSRSGDRFSGNYAGILQAAGKHKLSQSFTYAVITKSQTVLPPLRFSGQVKGTAAGDSISVEIAFSTIAKDEKTGQGQPKPLHTVTKSFDAPAKWTPIGLEISAADLAEPAKTLPLSAGVVSGTITLTSSATSAQVLLDALDLSVDRQPPAYTLVPNAGFEARTEKGRPASWSADKKSLRYFGQNYYVWRDWFHFLSEPRGTTTLDPLMVRSGKTTLRMNVPPGDDRHIETAAIALNQSQPRRMVIEFDYNSYMLANLMLQVVDEEGREIFGQNIVPGSTGEWKTFRTEFLPRKAQLKPGDVRAGGDLFGATGDARALKSCRLRIGVKGVNGSEMDDINQWVNVNHAGVLWVDNVVLAETESTAQELASRGATTFPLADAAPELAIENIDLGERLYGKNVGYVTIANRGATKASGTLFATLTGPYREDNPKKAGYAVGTAGQDKLEPRPSPTSTEIRVSYAVEPGKRATFQVPYLIHQLLPDWRSEYRMKLSLGAGRDLEIPFGTWSQRSLVDVERCYPFEEEKTLKVFMNLGYARAEIVYPTRLELEVRRVRDDQKVFAVDVPNLAEVKGKFNVAPLPEGFQGDSTNFVLASIPLDSLPVHPQTMPVRDHYISVTMHNTAKKTFPMGRSPAFGRMQVHTEKLDAISSVSIHKDNYLLVNGKPFYSRGHIWMQQNFGPAPLARDNTDWKRYGFNTKAGTQHPLPESHADRLAAGVNELWSGHNTYLNSQMVNVQPPLTDATRADLQKWIAKPNVLGIHFIPWEGEPVGAPDALIQYAKAIKGVIGTRPLWVSAGWFAPRVNGRLEPVLAEQDWYAPENNAYFQPSQLDKEVLANRAGKPCVLSTYPNVFNDAPWPVQRFEHWTEIIRHHTGYLQIGKPGDPTLMAGMNGELRFIESFLFSPDPPPAVSVSPRVEHLVRSTPKAHYVMATNAGPVIGGDWSWSTTQKDKGRAAHSGTSLWQRFHAPYMDDYYSHFYRDDRPVRANRGDRIVQYVYVPIKWARAQCLILMVRANGEWRHHAVWGDFDHKQFTDSGVRMWMAKDMHQFSWGSLGIGFCGPEGHDPKHPKLLQYTFTADQFHKIGPMPPDSRWVRLEVPVDELGLAGKLIDGFAFISKGRTVRWERTMIVQNGRENVLCDGSVGIPPQDLKHVRFEVAGLRAGTKVKVCFDERDITAQDGYFEDDLSGEPGYRNMWVGLYGDKLGETGYYGNGVNYNYNWGKIAARLYEIPR